jgi:hypothetical protein
MTLSIPLLFALSQSPLPDAPLPDATGLLDRREARLGPLEKRTALRGLVVRGEWRQPDGSVNATFEELHRVGPDEERVRISLTMEAFGTTSQGTDGKVSWTTDPSRYTSPSSAPQYSLRPAFPAPARGPSSWTLTLSPPPTICG